MREKIKIVHIIIYDSTKVEMQTDTCTTHNIKRENQLQTLRVTTVDIRWAVTRYCINIDFSFL
jgi:hypothetical protein